MRRQKELAKRTGREKRERTGKTIQRRIFSATTRENQRPGDIFFLRLVLH